MNIHKHSVFLLSFILLWSFKGLTQENDKTLNDYLIMAAENNPGLRVTFNDYMAAMEKVPQAGTLPDPQFAFGYFINPVETRLGPQKATFGLQQAFPWFGLLSAREDASSELAKAAYEVFENKKSNLYFEVKTAFYNYYFMEKAIQITKDNIEILRIFKNLSLVKIEAGNASIIDELRVEMELNDLENQLALFIDSKTVFQSKFNNLLNRDPAELIESPEKIWNDELPYEKMTLLDSIYGNNHELKSYGSQIKCFYESGNRSEKRRFAQI